MSKWSNHGKLNDSEREWFFLISCCFDSAVEGWAVYSTGLSVIDAMCLVVLDMMEAVCSAGLGLRNTLLLLRS